MMTVTQPGAGELLRAVRQPIKSLTLMVCTYNRPTYFAGFIRSVANLEVPKSFQFCLAVADNNKQSQYDNYIGNLIKKLPYPTLYGHEPNAGYSNARNKAIELALRTDSEIFAFVDDDFELDPNWLIGHIRSHQELDADAINGRLGGQSRVPPHGQVRIKTGLGNVSFRRHWVDSDGLNLRFDPKFNTTGYEDWDFTSRAIASGQRMLNSDFTVAWDCATLSDEAKRAEHRNRVKLAAAKATNAVADLRQSKGFIFALASAIGSLRYLLKAFRLFVKAIIQRKKNATEDAELTQQRAIKSLAAIPASFRGLNGKTIARHEVRRGG